MEPRADVSRIGIGDMDPMIIDCGRCERRGDACAECPVSVLLGAPPAVEWDADEQRAVDALVEAGMLPRLHLVPITPVTGGSPVSGESAAHRRSA